MTPEAMTDEAYHFGIFIMTVVLGGRILKLIDLPRAASHFEDAHADEGLKPWN